jgi:BASS family bile acid:Na+ symporter
MESSIVTTLLLPVALGIVMLGLGLSLTVADFARVVRYPKAVLVGLFAQTVVLVAGAYVIARLAALPPELAVGLMLLAASPGGATANIYSHLAHGDVALNITLTAINSLLALVTLPLIVDAALVHFLDQDQYVPPPTRKVIEVAAIIVLPVLIGMALRAGLPKVAAALEKPIRLFAVLVLVAVIGAAIVAEWERLPGFIAAVGAACLAFNLLSMAVGYGLPRLLDLPRSQAIAISMEIGIHNGTLAIFIALTVLQSATMSVPAAVYSIIMFVTASAFTLWLNRRPGSGHDASGARSSPPHR